MTVPDILVLRALGLGDFVTGLPALSMLRDAYPLHRIVLAAPRSLTPLVKLTGLVDRQVNAGELNPIESPPTEPELAIDLHGNGPLSRALLEPCRPRRLLAYADGAVQWRHNEHEVERWCRLLREGLPLDGAPTPRLAGLLPVPQVHSPRGLTVVHCGAKSASRQWHECRLAAVAMLLSARGHRVVVTGGAGEADRAERIAAAAGVDMLIEPTLLELASVIARARLVVSGDTGVAHLASVYETPSVVLFGPVSPARWGPPDTGIHQVIWHGDDSGDPHGDTIDPALDRITVAEVVAAVDRALPVTAVANAS
jgi:ADP-heptose:LPS heptosyltransferase